MTQTSSENKKQREKGGRGEEGQSVPILTSVKAPLLTEVKQQNFVTMEVEEMASGPNMEITTEHGTLIWFC